MNFFNCLPDSPNMIISNLFFWYGITPPTKSLHTIFTFQRYGYNILLGGGTMALNPKQFGTVMKNARMDKKLTQAELAEILDLSLSYLKDLERFKNTPSLEVFARTIQYFNLSADTVIYPDKNLQNNTYQEISRRLLQCNENQLKIILATTEAVLSVDNSQSRQD